MSLGRVLLVLVLVGGLAALLTGAALLAWIQTPHGDGPKSVTVEIPAGTSARETVSILQRKGVVSRPWLFSRALRLTGVHRQIKSGEYQFELPVAPIEVMRILHEGRVFTVPITLQEGLTLDEIADTLAAAGVATRDALLDAFREPRLVEDIDPSAGDLEGYLFPDTYRFARNSEPGGVAGVLVGEFRRRFLEPHEQAIADSELSLREIVTLASLVEKETALPEERPLIAGVFAERLDRGMLMQCDPTVIYALKLEGRWDGNIRRADLSWDHPYNTYVRPGLPPGPIASPGLPSLLAAIGPQRSGALYFVSRGDGGHVFSRTLAEHNANVRRYQLRRR